MVTHKCLLEVKIIITNRFNYFSEAFILTEEMLSLEITSVQLAAGLQGDWQAIC